MFRHKHEHLCRTQCFFAGFFAWSHSNWIPLNIALASFKLLVSYMAPPLSSGRYGPRASEHCLPGEPLHLGLFPHSFEAVPLVTAAIRTNIHTCLPEINVCNATFSQGQSLVFSALYSHTTLSSLRVDSLHLPLDPQGWLKVRCSCQAPLCPQTLLLAPCETHCLCYSPCPRKLYISTFQPWGHGN